MLLDGVNHVAVITDDTDRFVEFYQEVFDATVAAQAADRSGRHLDDGGHRPPDGAERLRGDR